MKKGALQLGISTIVVLVIAMVLIAVGVSLIRGLTGIGEEKLASAFEVGDFGLQPTRDDPLVLQDGQIDIKAGTTEFVRVGFYNKESSPVEEASIDLDTCTGGLTEGTNVTIDSLAQTIPGGETAGYETVVKVVSGTTQGIYTCQIKLVDSAKKVVATDQIRFNIFV